MQDIRALNAQHASDAKIPIFGYQPASVTATMRILGPVHKGGKGDMDKMIEDEIAMMKAEATKAVSEDDAEAEVKVDHVEAARRVFQRCEGKVVRAPGLPPMYDWEFFPQEVSTRSLRHCR